MESWMLDAAFVVLVLVSSVIAFTRGFVREVLSAAAVVGAFLGTFWSFETLRGGAQDALAPLGAPTWVADVTVIVGVFLVIFLAIMVVTKSIEAVIQRSEGVAFIDRTAGLAFGVVRGVVVAALGVLMANALVTERATKDAIASAQSYPVIAPVARIIQSILPEGARGAEDLFPER